MTETAVSYVLDANVFIEAKRRYYAFDLCPGFWNFLIQHEQACRLLSVRPVWKELMDYKDELSDWVSEKIPQECFASCETEEVAEAYARLIAWVFGEKQFSQAAKDEFAREPDGWLIAYALAYGHTVVTHEVYAPDVKKRVPIPNVCRAFGIRHVDTFEMLRALAVRFVCGN